MTPREFIHDRLRDLKAQSKEHDAECVCCEDVPGLVAALKAAMSRRQAEVIIEQVAKALGWSPE